MMDYTLPYFGKILLTNPEEYYDIDIEFNGSNIQLDLNFEDTAITTKQLDKVKWMLDNLIELDLKNKEYIKKDYNDEDGDTVRFYLEHHLGESDNEHLLTLVDFNNEAITPERQLLAKLNLVRVGFYPDNEENFAVFDYSVGTYFTDYLVVINLDADGKIDYMTMES